MTKQLIPVTHETEIILPLQDLSLYYLLISTYSKGKKEQTEHGEGIKYTIQKKEFILWSKFGGFINPKTQQRAFEYCLSCGDKNSPSKITIMFKPMFGEGTKTISGKTNNITKKGTDIKIYASYYELKDSLSIIQTFLNHIDGSRFYDMINLEKGLILKFERHIRYNENKEVDIREKVFKIIHQLSATRGDYDIRDTVTAGATMFYKISAPTYDFMGLSSTYQINLKSYRFDAYADKVTEDCLRHPKLEVFMGKSKEYPKASEYEIVKAKLDEFLINLINFAGLKDDDLIEDLFFKKQYQETNINIQEWPPKEWKESFRHGQELPKTFPLENPRELELLLLMATSQNGCISKIKLQEQTKTPERTLWRWIEDLKNRGLIDTINEGITQIYFRSRVKWAQIKGALLKLVEMGCIPGYITRYGQLFTIKYETEGERLERLGDTMNPEDHYIISDHKKTIGDLLKDVKELGIKMIWGIEVLHRPEASKVNDDFWNLQRRRRRRRPEFAPLELF